MTMKTRCSATIKFVHGPWVVPGLPDCPRMVLGCFLHGPWVVSAWSPRCSQDGPKMVPTCSCMVPHCMDSGWSLDGPWMVPGWSLDNLSRAPRGSHSRHLPLCPMPLRLLSPLPSPPVHSHSCVYTPPFSCIPDLMADLTNGLATCRTTRTPAPALSTILKIQGDPIPTASWE